MVDSNLGGKDGEVVFYSDNLSEDSLTLTQGDQKITLRRTQVDNLLQQLNFYDCFRNKHH